MRLSFLFVIFSFLLSQYQDDYKSFKIGHFKGELIDSSDDL